MGRSWVLEWFGVRPLDIQSGIKFTLDPNKKMTQEKKNRTNA